MSHMTLEARVFLDLGGEVIDHPQSEGRTSSYIPDDDDYWFALWDLRHQLSGIAHSHPAGITGPSLEDITTFSAIERGINRRLDWWILSDDTLTLTRWIGPDKHSYRTLPVRQRAPWVSVLRELSQPNITGDEHGRTECDVVGSER